MANWTGPELREWQRQALDTYIAKNSSDFLAVATPGAGKTKFALRLAHDLLAAGTVQRVVVVVPSDHLKIQWADSAHECGFSLDPTTKNANGLEVSTDFKGAVLTYAQVAKQPDLHRMGCSRRDTLVILDEVHHAGDEKAWGEAIRYAFGDAARRLSLSGTPFRSDNNPIPFVTYGPDDKSVADFTYGYGRAIRDEVCRQVDFHFYDGEMRWMDSGVVTSSANLSADLAEGDASAALDTALDPKTSWMRGVLGVADKALTDLRREVPCAGGLVIAYRAGHARAYAQMLTEITGEEPTVVLSEDGPGSEMIDGFAKADSRWLVAVRMVSEGVDVPRLAVGVYATKTKTEMFFRQAVGRFVRRKPDEEHTAIVFAPALPGLRIMAAQIEQEIQHEIDRNREEAEAAERDGGAPGQLSFIPHIPLGSSDPVFDRAILGGQEYTPEENARAEALLKKHGFSVTALPSLRKLVREDLASEQPVTVPEEVATAVQAPAFKVKKELKATLTTLARRLAISTGAEHQTVQWEVNQHMGVRTRDKATIEQLKGGIDYVTKRLGGSR